MYQNMWGYMITAAMIQEGSLPNPVSAANVNRYAIANAVFDEYAPDVLCFQEMNTERSTIENHLLGKGYAKVGGDHYDQHPVWYNTSVLSIVASGTNKGYSHYHSNWVIFEVKTGANAGEKFAVTNSHFTANSMTQDDADLGDQARQKDGESLLKSVADAKAAGPEGMPIITGGDYNCNLASDAYAVLTDGGLINVRDLAETTANISCHHGVSYNESSASYKLPGEVSSSVASAIDHIMVYGETKDAIVIKEYDVVGDAMTAVSSDHAPHFIDFNFN
jgi:endonuclease/exonuclease/phosphatase family metal-dependent hydrolase